MAEWVVGVANASPHFALRAGDIPVRIHNTAVSQRFRNADFDRHAEAVQRSV